MMVQPIVQAQDLAHNLHTTGCLVWAISGRWFVLEELGRPEPGMLTVCIFACCDWIQNTLS